MNKKHGALLLAAVMTLSLLAGCRRFQRLRQHL